MSRLTVTPILANPHKRRKKAKRAAVKITRRKSKRTRAPRAKKLYSIEALSGRGKDTRFLFWSGKKFGSARGCWDKATAERIAREIPRQRRSIQFWRVVPA